MLTNRALRVSDKLQMGIEVELAGQHHYITSERQQILDLLISTFEEAVRLNTSLGRSNQMLNGLYRVAEDLNARLSEDDAVNNALERLLELPGIPAGCIYLLQDGNQLVLSAHRNLPSEMSPSGQLEADFPCKRQFIQGELQTGINIPICELLSGGGNSNRWGTVHASIPIWVTGKPLGLLNLANADGDPFSEDELRLLSGVGYQLGLALERARLHGRLESLVDERTAALVAEIEVRKEVEEQLHHAQRMESIDRLAGGIAHDLNNVLQVVNGFTDSVLVHLEKGSRLHSDPRQVREAGERGADIVGQILAFRRRQVLQVKPLALNTAVKQIERMLGRLLGEDIDLRTRLAPDLDFVSADQVQIEQVLMNLAVNARDAMPQGGLPTIETANVLLDETYAAQHMAVPPGRYVVLIVSDTGQGFDAETRKHIFDPFFTTKGPGSGTGLGLATVYGIVKQHQGSIWVYSEPGRGTTFKIYLPSIGGDSSSWQEPASNVESPQGTETVLVVEDNSAVRELICLALRANGYQVLEAPYVENALDFAMHKDTTIHLLLTDVIMPRMNGRELHQRLTEFRPELRVLYISGYTDKVIAHHGVLEKGVAFVQKPFAVQDLLRKVREVLQ